MQPNFQEPVVEYCEPEQVIDICSYNDYPILDKSSQKQDNCNDDKDIYDTSELEHEFEYRIYEDVLKTEQLMAKLKRIDEAENENKKLRDVHFGDFPLEQFSDAGKVANEGDPHLKAAADTELYDLEKRAIQIDIEKHEYDNSSKYTVDYSSQRAEDYSSQRADDNDDDISQNEVSQVQSAKNTMSIMMITHCVKWFTDQGMCHIMKTARKYCCHKLQICHKKTISNCYIIHYLRLCAITNTKA